MSARERHTKLVTSVAESVRTVPLTPEELAGGFRTRAETAREEADGNLVEAERNHHDLLDGLTEAETNRDQRRSAFEDAESRHGEAEHECAAREADRAALDGEIREVDQRSAELSALLDEQRGGSDSLPGLLERVDQAFAMVLAQQLDAPAIARVANELEVVAVSAASNGRDELATALDEWATAFRDGTAPITPEAEALLESFAVVDQGWHDLGSGDLSKDPGVMAAAVELASAKAAVDELDRQMTTGTVGLLLATSIEQAHERRTALESQDKPSEELAAAVAAEADALALAGFDSMLDFQIAMSTHGVGALAGKRRESVDAQMAEAQHRLEQAQAAGLLAQDELRARLAELEERVDVLLGEPFTGDPRIVLAGLAAIPAEAAAHRDDLAGSIHANETATEDLRNGLADLAAHRAQLDEDHTRTMTAAEEAAASLAAAGAARDTAEVELAEAEEGLEEIRRQVAMAAIEVEQASNTRESLAQLRYAQADVIGFRDEVLTAVAARAADVTPAGPGPGAVVVDDPLTDLDAPDARDVFQALLEAAWGVPVLYVTARPELISMVRDLPTDVMCVDSRRWHRGRLWSGLPPRPNEEQETANAE